MSGDAVFAALLAEESAQRCVLVEMTHAYEAGGAPAAGTVYLSSTYYTTGPADQPASVSYIDAILAAPSFSRRIDEETLGGRAVLTLGTLELDNTDGRLAFLLTLVVDGQPCSIYLGNPAWPRSEFRRVLYTLVEKVTAPSPDRIVVTLRDPGLLLNARVAGGVIGGSGSNAARRKPLVIGAARNVEGILGDSTNLRYWIGFSGAPADVRDNGVSLYNGYPSAAGTSAAITPSAAADTFTIAAHTFQNEQVITFSSSGTLPAPIVGGGQQYWVRNRTASTFQVSLTRTGAIVDLTDSTFAGTMIIIARGYYINGDGSIDLSATPSGVVTADCGSEASLSSAMETLALTHAGLPPSLFGGYATDTGGYWGTTDEPKVALVVYEPENVTDLLDQVAAAGHCFWGFTLDGVLKFGRIRPQTPVGATGPTITEDDLVSRDAFEVDRLPPQYDQYACVVQKNWTVQSTVAASVTPANAALYAGPGLVRRGTAPSGTAYSTNPGLYHLTLGDSPEIETTIAAALDADAQAWGDAWLAERAARFAPHVDIVRLQTRLTAYTADLGDTVELDVGIAGVGYGANRTGVLVGIDVDLTGGRVSLTVARKTTPDPITSAHYG